MNQRIIPILIAGAVIVLAGMRHAEAVSSATLSRKKRNMCDGGMEAGKSTIGISGSRLI